MRELNDKVLALKKKAPVDKEKLKEAVVKAEEKIADLTIDGNGKADLKKAVIYAKRVIIKSSSSNEEVKAVTENGVTFERKGKEDILDADAVLIATGRQPNMERLQLERAGIAFDRSGITVDEHLQTSVKGIYAIGDVNGRQMLAHAATMQGLHVVNRILGMSDSIRLDIMPAAIFTYPEAASVGLSEDTCKEQSISYKCHKAFHRANGKALAMDETEGMLKLLTDPSGLIIGCHAFGAHSADLIQEVSVLMCKHTTIDELRDMVHIHPTLSEVLQAAAES